MFVEAFTMQQDAETFCQDAGGTLAVPSNAEEAAELNQLLNSTLPYMAKWAYAISTDYALWMGLKRTNGEWGTMTQEPLGSYKNWALGEPSTDKDRSCSLFAWSWAKRKASWAAYVCGWANMAHAAVCKLPPFAGKNAPALPKGMHGLPLPCQNSFKMCLRFRFSNFIRSACWLDCIRSRASAGENCLR
jgi:hypothetical protein